jgi:hypothetical protein
MMCILLLYCSSCKVKLFSWLSGSKSSCAWIEVCGCAFVTVAKLVGNCSPIVLPRSSCGNDLSILI